jgi:hypothetical protein
LVRSVVDATRIEALDGGNAARAGSLSPLAAGLLFKGLI